MNSESLALSLGYGKGQHEFTACFQVQGHSAISSGTTSKPHLRSIYPCSLFIILLARVYLFLPKIRERTNIFCLICNMKL